MINDYAWNYEFICRCIYNLCFVVSVDERGLRLFLRVAEEKNKL